MDFRPKEKLLCNVPMLPVGNKVTDPMRRRQSDTATSLDPSGIAPIEDLLISR